MIVRGIERKKIFRSDYDRNNLLNRLSDLIPQSRTDCFAWALMPDHKELRKAGIRVKGDERILGDSDFVENVLKAADEKLEQQFALSTQGYDFHRTVQRVAQVLGMAPKEVTAFGKSPRTVKARSLLCYWAHRKLGMTTVEIAAKLSICQSAVSRLSMKGEKFANEKKFELIEIKS